MGFDLSVKQYHESFGQEKQVLRSGLIRELNDLDDPYYVERFLGIMLNSHIPGRLDDAIDVLYQAPVPLTRLTLLLPLFFNKDYWYVVIRALGRSGLPEAHALIDSIKDNSGEAYAEALEDLNGNNEGELS